MLTDNTNHLDTVDALVGEDESQYSHDFVQMFVLAEEHLSWGIWARVVLSLVFFLRENHQETNFTVIDTRYPGDVLGKGWIRIIDPLAGNVSHVSIPLPDYTTPKSRALTVDPDLSLTLNNDSNSAMLTNLSETLLDTSLVMTPTPTVMMNARYVVSFVA